MTWLREWVGGPAAADATDSDESEEMSANVSHNPPVRRENKKTERERKKMKLMKAEERRLAKLKTERICQSSVLRSVVKWLLLWQVFIGHKHNTGCHSYLPTIVKAHEEQSVEHFVEFILFLIICIIFDESAVFTAIYLQVR